MRVAILLFPGVEEMDFVGPLEIFGAAANHGANIHTTLAAQTPEIRCAHGLEVQRLQPIADAVNQDLLVLPGGGWLGPADSGVRSAIADAEIIDVIKSAHGNGATIASVCTGAFILAEAGLLMKIPASTHHDAAEYLRAMGARVIANRVVDAGNIVTAGGVTSGIDLALWLVERFLGPSLAATVEEYLEYKRTGDVVLVDEIR